MSKIKVLVLKTSMIKNNSISNELNDEFVRVYKKHAPNDEIIVMDLNEDAAANISMNKENLATFFSPEHSDKHINLLKSVDKVIISVPMTNFNVNAVTKNYFDHINVANKTFSYKYSKKGDAVGLLDHLNVQVLTTQGAPLGWYPWGNHSEYLKGQWAFFGATISEHILISGTKLADKISKTPLEVVKMYQDEINKKAEAFAKLKKMVSKF